MEKIALLGAVDRYNYGDLLFPHIINCIFHQFGAKIEFEVFGIINSNLSNIGAFPTKSYDEFVKYLSNNDNVHIIIVGGETMGTTWINLYSYLSAFYLHLSNLNSFLHNKISPLIENLFKYSKTKYPFIINKNDFPVIKTISYNAVGGRIRKVNEIKFLQSADYISLRSQRCFLDLQSHGLNVSYTPDSAILMSDIWPLKKLNFKISSKLNLPPKYIYIQINKDYFLKKKNIILKTLSNLYEQTTLPLVLCPIGLANGHEDQFGLSYLHNRLQIPHKYITEPTLWDIMYAIANSSLYIGTSLHGIITAMSFHIPYIGLNRSSKISEYLKEWAIDELKKAIDVENLLEAVNYIFNKDLTDKLYKSSEQMKKEARSSLFHIYTLIHQ